MLRAVATCLVLTMVLTVSGCTQSSERLNAPPQGAAEQANPLQEQYVYMQDNALLADMSISDIHFVPHTAELNGLGARRLNRYAQLLAVYGGTLHYDTELDGSDPLIQKRVEHAVEYAKLAGLDPDKFEIVVGHPGGRGVRATDAIEALDAADTSESRRAAIESGMSSGY
ncbi:MAG: hypothetical protein JSU68_01645 [Phycisphaerales bacterium]|nr:MAG: hypothetical protein JSU68_01645 [Phycisphaerales bacterium]